MGIEYTVGRLVAVASRPLFLLIANNYLGVEAAQGVAVAFLVVSLAMIATAADAHRPFYVQQFEGETGGGGLVFYVYVVSHLILAVLGGLMVWGLTWHLAASGVLAVSAVLYLWSEKIADELLRLRLFQREFGVWGQSLIARSVVQLGGLGVLMLWMGGRAPAPLAVALLTLGNVVVFSPQLPASMRRILSVRSVRVVGWLARRAVAMLRANWRLWAIALVSASIGYVDRVLGFAIDPANLPIFLLVVMCFSIVRMSVDFAYLSRHRRDFLQQRLSVRGAMLNWEFMATIVAGLGLASIAVTFVLRAARGADSFPLLYVLAIGALHTSVAISLIPREISYWTHAYGLILRIEGLFWALFASAAGALWMLGLGAGEILAAAACCAWVRLAMHLVVASRARPSSVGAASRGTTVLEAP